MLFFQLLNIGLISLHNLFDLFIFQIQLSLQVMSFRFAIGLFSDHLSRKLIHFGDVLIEHIFVAEIYIQYRLQLLGLKPLAQLFVHFL